MKTRTALLALLLIGFATLLTYMQSISTPLSFINEASYLGEPYDKKGLIKAGLYLGSYLLSLLALISILFIKNSWFAHLLLASCALFFGVDLLVQLLGSSRAGITTTVLATALNEAGRATDLLVYKTPLLYAGLAVVGIFMLGLLIRRLISTSSRINFIWSLSFLLVTTVGIGLLSYRIPSITTQSYLAPIKPALILQQYLNDYHAKTLRLLDTSIKPIKLADYRTIVWLIDESISGNYLSVNGYTQATTPFLDKFKLNASMQNYGVVAPISNCSNTSNLLLRIGLTSRLQQDFKTARNTLPTIFQYAKQAGFETHLIDAQIAPGEMQNNLSNQDLKFIDYNLAFERAIHPQERDQQVLTELNKLLNTELTKKKFIVVVKWGAHWPYSLAYPQEKTLFKPAATESLTEIVEDNREIITNAYLNAVHYSVDNFLETLLARPLKDKQIIFYTSDHGQSLFEQAQSPITHCHYSTDPKTLPLGEFKVPLMVFTQEAKSNFPKLENRLYAQEQIFPTTLQLFGYDQTVYKTYGPTLIQGSDLNHAESFILDSGLRINIPKTEFK